VSQQVTKDTGISFETTKAQHETEHLASIVSTGEYPDAFFVFGAQNIDLLENEEVCYPWDELIAEFAPEFMDLIDPSEIAMATKDDGHFYTLYTHVRNQEYWDDLTKGVSYGQSVLCFRDDIMAELGNPVIESADDFYNLLVEVKEKYPNMIPYMQQRLNADALPWSFGIDYDGTKGMATIVDGSAIYTYSNREPVENYLKYANRLMREGLMSQEALSYEFEQLKAAVVGGDVFCYAAQAFDVDQINKAIAQLEGDDRYYTAMRRYLTVDGESRCALTYAAGGFAGFYISRACKDPGRLIALMEYMKSPYGDQLTQWGVAGLDYELVDGNPIQFDTYSWKERGDNVWYFQASFEAENQKAIAMASIEPRFGQVAHLVIDYKPYWKYDVALAMINAAEAGSKMGDIKATIDQIKLNAFPAAIIAQSEEDCQAVIDGFFADLDKAGLAEYNAYINDQYQVIKTRLAE
jgi:putative aldouronate transport system substrate-binding protein